MKNIFKSLSFVLTLLLLTMSSCVQKTQPQVTVQSNVVLSGVNFDLQALGELAVKYPNPIELEKVINMTGGINNLDLDENGQVDFINVTQYGDNTYVGLQFKAQLQDGESEIATIEYDKVTKQMNIAGNNNYYANDAYYSRPFNPIGFYLFMGYPRYHSPYYYGHYGSYYSPYSRVGYSSYHNRSIVTTSHSTTTYTKTNKPTKSKVTKPTVTNKSKVASANATKKKTTLQKQQTKNGQKTGNATSTQKAPKVRDTNKKVNASGFGNKTKSTSKPTSTRSSSSRSSSSRSSSSRRSDITFKKNIKKLDDGLNMIMKIDAITYNYDTTMDASLPITDQIGFSAQQLLTIVPESVLSDSLGYRVDYITIIPVLTKALQQQQAIIVTLNARLNELETQVNL